MRKKSRFGRRFPWTSTFVLALSLIGTLLFSIQSYRGAEEIRRLSDDVFAFLVPWMDRFQVVIVVLALIMIGLTILMTVVGLAAGHRSRMNYQNVKKPSKKSPIHRFFHRLGHRLVVACAWVFTYVLNICWLGILSITVVLTSAYLAFLPVCLPQAGFEKNFCFNFTLFSLLVSHGNDANMVSLILCGGPVDKFCKISKSVMPWFWGSFAGCIIILLSLSHYNANLAASFAHNQHGRRYRKLHAKYGNVRRRSADSSSASKQAKKGYQQNGHTVDNGLKWEKSNGFHQNVVTASGNYLLDDRTEGRLQKRLSMDLMQRY